MPELPEVETVVRALAPALVGRTIERARVLHQPSVSGSPAKLAKLRGLKVEALTRRGKYIRATLSEGWGLAVHLRMTGWLGILRNDQRDEKMEPYVRVRLDLDGGAESLIFRDIRTFGRTWFGKQRALDELPALAKLGPEPLEIGVGEFTDRLRSRRGRVKSVLLDQTFVAGIGNIYADETLFAAGVHPLASAEKISPAKALEIHREMQRLLNIAIAAGGSSIDDFVHPDGQSGWFQRELHVYGRAGEPCARCENKIQRMVVGQRGTWFCSKCQRKR